MASAGSERRFLRSRCLAVSVAGVCPERKVHRLGLDFWLTNCRCAKLNKYKRLLFSLLLDTRCWWLADACVGLSLAQVSAFCLQSELGCVETNACQ